MNVSFSKRPAKLEEAVASRTQDRRLSDLPPDGLLICRVISRPGDGLRFPRGLTVAKVKFPGKKVRRRTARLSRL